MSCGKLPQLLYVNIKDAPRLGQVFGWKQGERQKLILENVLPKLIAIRLVELPTLHTICQGIDFQTVKIRHVRRCPPAISLTSTYGGSYHELAQLLSHTLWDDGLRRSNILLWVYEDGRESELGEAPKSPEDEWESEGAESSEVIEEDSIVSPKSPEIREEGSSQEGIKKDSTIPQQNNGSANFENDTIASTSGIVEEKLSTTPSSSSDMNLKATFGEGPSFEKYDKESSSASSKPKTEEPYTLTPSEELCGKEPMGDQQAPGENKISNEPPQRVKEPIKEFSSKETSNEMVSSIPSPKKPQIATSASHVEMESGISAITDHTAQDKIMDKPETSAGKPIKFDQGNQKQFAEDDLMRLFRIMDEGAEMEVHIPDVSKIAALRDDNELKKALTDLEASLRMSLSEITCSEESKLRLENALNILSSHCSEEGAPSHGLQATIHSLQQEIQTVLSSSKQAYASIDTFNELERKEKLITEEASKRKEAATTLLSKIHNKESSLAEAQQKEAELKEKISKIQAEVYRKEKEIQECEIELLSLKKQKKKSVFETMGLINQFDAVKRDRWLQKLKRLEVLDCEELASIIEDEEDQKNPMPLPQNVKIRHARECPNISLTSANDSYDELRGFSWLFQIHSQDEEEYYAEILNWAFEISSISSPKKPQIETSAPHMEVETKNSQSDPLLASTITDQSAKGQITVNQRGSSVDNDLNRLLQIMKGGFELEVGQPYISKFAAFEDDEVAKAFDDLESSLKMDLNQIANSKEPTHCLENALNFLSIHFSKDETSSHGLIRGKIDSLREEILKFISSFKQANDKLDRFTKLLEKEKWVDEEYAQKMEVANTIVSEIRNTENYMIELEGQVSRLQAELKSNKEKELEDCEIKLSSLQKQKKECVLDVIRFMGEYEAVKKDKSHMVGSQIRVSQELKELENQWPCCLVDSRKTALLLGILLQQ
ncbi:uncharacterized protein LOC114742483 [Neltuma alba]|uniref:uncharacterized protein LOC114742483 n=1 Tax=Neltuma alba TaxID=207710 RepID=UPI0010A4F3F9|nr:uncharacterized protein LOC114742483 [Prosopis alba]